MSSTTIVSQEVAHQGFLKAMQLYVGAGKRWSCQDVADATGIPKRTVESYRSGQATPSIENFQSLVSVLGLGFFRTAVSHLPFEIHSNDASEVSPQEALTGALSFGTHLAKCLEDGHIDHIERKDLKLGLNDLIKTLSNLETGL